MANVSKTDDLNAKDINNKNFDNSTLRAELYRQLKQREHHWWQACQHLIRLKERQMFWFGDNSFMMWLLWQLVSYVVVAMVLMSISKLLNISLPLWQYVALFVLQTLIFIIMLAFKGQLANNLQRRINKQELLREEALNEMTILAADSLYLDVHEKAPISLKALYEHYDAQFHLSSLQCLLKQEVDAGRLLLTEQQLEANILPPNLADDELNEHASEMIYKSII